MKERILIAIKNIFQPKEITAGNAMASFMHAKSCPAYSKDISDAADFLQIGTKRVYVFGGGGTWGVSDGGYANVTYILCNGCKREKVFQER